MLVVLVESTIGGHFFLELQRPAAFTMQVLCIKTASETKTFSSLQNGSIRYVITDDMSVELHYSHMDWKPCGKSMAAAP